MQENKISYSNNKLIAKISWLGASSIIKYLSQFASIILFVNKISLEEYGAYQEVWIVTNLFCTIIPFGLSTLLLSANTAAVKNWITTNSKKIVCLGLLGVTGLVTYLLFAMQNFGNIQKLFLFILIIFQILSLIGEAILVKQAKEKTIFWINSIYFIGYFLLHYFIVIKNYNLSTLLLGLIIITIVKSFFLFMLKNRTEKYFEEDKKIKSEWIYLGTNDALYVITKWLDKWIILFLLPTASFAIYFNGTYEIPIFLLLLSAVASVSIVEISKQKQENTDAILDIFKKPIFFLAAIVLPSFAFLYYNAASLFQLLFSNKYNESVPIFLVTLFLLPVRTIYSTSVLQAFGKSKIIVQGVIIDLILAVIFMIILYPIFGQKGLAASFVLSTYIQSYYYLWHTGKLLNKKVLDLVPLFSLMLTLVTSVLIAKGIFALTIKLNAVNAIMVNSIICLANMALVYFVLIKGKISL